MGCRDGGDSADVNIVLEYFVDIGFWGSFVAIVVAEESAVVENPGRAVEHIVSLNEAGDLEHVGSVGCECGLAVAVDHVRQVGADEVLNGIEEPVDDLDLADDEGVLAQINFGNENGNLVGVKYLGFAGVPVDTGSLGDVMDPVGVENLCIVWGFG